MKKLLTAALLAPAIFSASCGAGNTNKKYQYTGISAEQRMYGHSQKKEESRPHVIIAPNDTMAYIEAYSWFLSGIYAARCVQNIPPEGTKKRTTFPISFNLTDENGNDITNIEFVTKAEQELKMLKDSGMVFEETDNYAKIRELNKNFYSEKDKYIDDLVWVFHNDANPNGGSYVFDLTVFLYFEGKPAKNPGLRFKLVHGSFFHDMKFTIDGKSYDYYPPHGVIVSQDMKKNYFDEPAIDSNKELIYALANADRAQVNIGKSYYGANTTWTIDKKQLLAIKQTLELYNTAYGYY